MLGLWQFGTSKFRSIHLAILRFHRRDKSYKLMTTVSRYDFSLSGIGQLISWPLISLVKANWYLRRQGTRFTPANKRIILGKESCQIWVHATGLSLKDLKGKPRTTFHLNVVCCKPRQTCIGTTCPASLWTWTFHSGQPLCNGSFLPIQILTITQHFFCRDLNMTSEIKFYFYAAQYSLCAFFEVKAHKVKTKYAFPQPKQWLEKSRRHLYHESRFSETSVLQRGLTSERPKDGIKFVGFRDIPAQLSASPMAAGQRFPIYKPPWDRKPIVHRPNLSSPFGRL